MKIFFAVILLSAYAIASDADERIFIDAKINGKPVRFTFDTGTGVPFALYSTTAQKLNLKVTPPPPDYQPGSGQTAFGWIESCDLDFGITNFTASLNVVEMPPYLKWPEDGMLGWPAISNNIFSIDCVANAVNFYTNLPEGLASWSKFDIQNNSNSGSLTLELSHDKNQREIIALDTGCSDGVHLNPKGWDKWETTHTNQPVTLDAYYTPSIGLVVKQEVWAHRIAIVSLVLTDVPVQEANSSDVALNSLPNTQYEATLGFAALKRLDIIIDGKHGIAYLRPKKTPSLPYWHNRLGAVFVPQDLQSDDLVAHVINSSPAFEAGIRDGDVLLKIGSLDCTKWQTDSNVLPLSRFWNSSAGTKLELTLKRSDIIFTTTAVLRNILPPDSAKN